MAMGRASGYNNTRRSTRTSAARDGKEHRRARASLASFAHGANDDVILAGFRLSTATKDMVALEETEEISEGAEV